MADFSNPACVLITGATGAIGAALAREYAAAGRVLVLHGRDAARLSAVAIECEARGAQVHTLVLDLVDAPAAVDALRALSERQPLDLVIVNAGVAGETEQVEDFECGRSVLAVNVQGALATVAGVLPAMLQRGRGQIALISSLSAFLGLPRSPTYSASKAALKTYGEALRGRLWGRGVAVNVIMPGFVESRLTERFPGPKPWLMKPDRAARLIQRGLARNRARYAFPFLFSRGTWLLSVLPAAVAVRIVRWLGY